MAAAQSAARQGTRDVVVFRVDDMLCGLDIRQIQEIKRLHAITPVHRAPPYVRGLVNMRGQIITLIDLRARLGRPPRPPNQAVKMIIVAQAGELVGLLVDGVDDVVQVEPGELQLPPTNLRGAEGQFVSAVVRADVGLIALLDKERVATREGASGSGEGAVTQLRVMVVDDSASFRSVLAGLVDRSGSARVVAHAGNGQEALEKAAAFAPDVITLDLEMPVLSGLDALVELRRRCPRAAVIMVSAHTRAGAATTMKALELGAHDFVAKPNGSDAEANREQLRAQLHRLLQGLAQDAAPVPPAAGVGPGAPAARPVSGYAPPQVLVIGASTGGPAALGKIVPRLPAELPVPVLLVQHMPPLFTATLAESLALRSALKVVEAQHGVEPRPGTLYIAPGGQHLKVVSASGARRLELSGDPPEHFCRPAVDYLFRSVAAVYGGRALAVILTGMGKDGALGLRALKKSPVKVIGQSRESCTVYGMPREAMAAGVVDLELPAERIAQEIAAGFGLQARP